MWDFSAVSWHKPSGTTLNLSGVVKCAVALNVAVQGVDVSIPMDLSNANCVHPHLGNNATDTNPANRFVFNNGTDNQFSPIKFTACGNFHTIDPSLNGSVSISANNCSSIPDVAKIYDEDVQSEVQFKPYYKVSLIEYFKPGPGQHQISSNALVSGCLGGGANGYATSGTGAGLKQAWAVAETSSSVNVVNIPWGAPARGMATRIEFFQDAACTAKRLDSVYFDGLLQTLNSKVDKIAKIGGSNVGYLFLAANHNGAGYTPFWSILPNIKCFDGASITSCLPYSNFASRSYVGEVQHQPMTITPMVFNGTLANNNQCVYNTASPALPGGVTISAPTFSSPGGGPNGGGICTLNVTITNGFSYDQVARNISVTFSDVGTNPETIWSNTNTPAPIAPLVLPQAQELKIQGPSTATGCSSISISGHSGVLASPPIYSSPVFNSGDKTCSIKLLNVQTESGPASSWTSGVYPSISVYWPGPNTTTNHYFAVNSTNQTHTHNRYSVAEIKKLAFELVGYGDEVYGQKDPHAQTSTWGGGDEGFNGKVLSLREELGSTGVGGLLAKMYKTCSQLMNARGTSFQIGILDKDDNPATARFEIKYGSVAKAPFQGGAGSFPLRIELFVNNVKESVIETDCSATTNPIYYFEEIRNESEGSKDSRKHRKYFIKAQAQNLTSANYTATNGDVEVEMIEMVERMESGVDYAQDNTVAKISLETFGGSKYLKLNSAVSRRQTWSTGGGNFSHSFDTNRMGGIIVPKSAGDASLFFDRMQDSINNNQYLFPSALSAPRQGGCAAGAGFIGQNNCVNPPISSSWNSGTVNNRHLATTITGTNEAIFDQCTRLDNFSMNSCTAPALVSEDLSGVFNIGAFSFIDSMDYDSDSNTTEVLTIPLNHDFISTFDEVNNSRFESIFFPNFN